MSFEWLCLLVCVTTLFSLYLLAFPLITDLRISRQKHLDVIRARAQVERLHEKGRWWHDVYVAELKLAMENERRMRQSQWRPPPKPLILPSSFRDGVAYVPVSGSLHLPGYEPDGIMQQAANACMQRAQDYGAVARLPAAPQKQSTPEPTPERPPAHWSEIRRSRSGPFTLKG